MADVKEIPPQMVLPAELQRLCGESTIRRLSAENCLSQ